MEKLLEILKLLQTPHLQAGFDYRFGICSNVVLLFASKHPYDDHDGPDMRRYFETWVKNNAYKWKHYSGLPAYPIPVPSANVARGYDAADMYDSTHDKWSGEYGAKRREFLQWAIDEITNQLKVVDN